MLPRTLELRSNHLMLSETDWRFREYALDRDECLRRASYAALDRGGKLILAPCIQAWPAFASRAMIQRLDLACRTVTGLLRRIPTLGFDDDPAAIARFYGFLEPDLVPLLLQEPNGIASTLTRGDFILDETGFKVLEINFSPALGGWESTVARRLHLEVPSTREFFEREGLAYETTDTMAELYEHVAGEVLAGSKPQGPLNLVYTVPKKAVLAHSDEARAWVQEAWERVLARRGREGLATIVDLAELTVRGRHLYHGERRIHAVIYGGGNHFAGRHLWPAYKAGGFSLFNGPLEDLLTDKRNLALLSERAAEGRLSAEDAEAVADYVPWSRIPGDGETILPDGSRGALLPYLLAHRDELILKEPSSFAAKGVVAGWAASDVEWRRAVEQASVEGDWVVQRRVRSLPFLFQVGEDGCAPHEVIWGPFLFGERYAGILLRMQPETVGDVVSVGRTGASAGFVAEVA